MYEDFRLKIYGLVEKPVNLTFEEIRSLPKYSITFDFRCIKGWEIKDSMWAGARVIDVLEIARPLADAKYVIFKANEYTITLSLDRILKGDVILAYEYMNKILPKEKGGPLRLVFPSQECYESVKWVNEIEVTDVYVEGTGKRIALSRVGKAR